MALLTVSGISGLISSSRNFLISEYSHPPTAVFKFILCCVKISLLIHVTGAFPLPSASSSASNAAICILTVPNLPNESGL